MTIIDSFEALIQTIQHVQSKACTLCEGSGKCVCSEICTCKENCPAGCAGSGICSECKGLGCLKPDRFSATVIIGTLASWIVAMSYVRNDGRFERFNEMWEVMSTWTIELQKASVQIAVSNGIMTQDDLTRNLRIMLDKYLEVENNSIECGDENSSALSRDELIALGLIEDDP